MRHLKPLLLFAGLILAVFLWPRHATLPTPQGGAIAATSMTSAADSLPAFLPAEARVTLERITTGGPWPYRQDGAVFGNYEKLLPIKPRGYYHEYTVDTPGASNRGARRIVTGGAPPKIYYYTDDHYRSFRRFEVPR